MAVLAFDTSTAQGSVAIVEGEKVLASKSWLREKSHSEFLTAEIEAVLKDANLKPKDLRALAIGHGPGSFTGIRVAVNAAKSLAYALGIKVYALDTTDILAEAVTQKPAAALANLPLLTLINAQKNSFFAAVYESMPADPESAKELGRAWRKIQPLKLIEIDELSQLLKRPHLCVGDGCIELESFIPAELKSGFVRDQTLSDYPSASVLGRMSEMSEKFQASLVWNEVQALYIRASGAEEKLREGLKR
jgi:tRNA threonylcarbamoyladenosine biosynthesis protein TsaB